MPTLEQKNRHAANLYWLAFLLTGARGESADMAVEAIESPEDTFFSAWMLAWSRKVVISKALAAIRQEFAGSCRQKNRPRPKPPLQSFAAARMVVVARRPARPNWSAPCSPSMRFRAVSSC